MIATAAERVWAWMRDVAGPAISNGTVRYAKALWNDPLMHFVSGLLALIAYAAYRVLS